MIIGRKGISEKSKPLSLHPPSFSFLSNIVNSPYTTLVAMNSNVHESTTTYLLHKYIGCSPSSVRILVIYISFIIKSVSTGGRYIGFINPLYIMCFIIPVFYLVKIMGVGSLYIFMENIHPLTP